MSKIRVFKTGATRNDDTTQLDYEGFLSPLVEKRFAEWGIMWKEITWAAGLFEGEGWVGFSKTKGRIRKDGTSSKPEGYRYSRLGMSLTDEDTILKFHRIVASGTIRGPYNNKNGVKPIWYWQASGEEAFAVAFLLYPYLGERRKSRVREVFGVGVQRGSSESISSPLAMDAFGKYMQKHRVQADGTVRDSDNWQKGIPLNEYMKSGWRHFMDWWFEHRGHDSRDGLEDALCGLRFNVDGYLHEILKSKKP